MIIKRWIGIGIALVVALLGIAVTTTHAADLTLIRVNVFPGVGNLAIFAGQTKGFFAKQNLEVELQMTPNSPAQRAGLAQGEFEIAHAAVDNAVAMVEMAKVDAVIVMGGDNSMQELFVQPSIASIADLKGKTVIVDAPNTAYALIVKKALLREGLKAARDYQVTPTGGTSQRLQLIKERPDYAASMLNPPYSIIATRDGFKSLGTVARLVGPYQGIGAFVMRPWAQANGARLEKYIRAYVEALRWATAPANRADAVAMLAYRLKLTPDIAAATYDAAVGGGFARDARFDMEGFKNVLAIRAETEGQWGGTPPAPDRYLDLSYYERAVASLGR